METVIRINNPFRNSVLACAPSIKPGQPCQSMNCDQRAIWASEYCWTHTLATFSDRIGDWWAALRKELNASEEFDNRSLIEVTFRSRNLGGLHNKVFRYTSFFGAQFYGIKFIGDEFLNSEWTGSIFRRCVFRNATFKDCKLKYCDFKYSSFDEVTITNSVICDTVFGRESTLAESRFPDSTFRQVRIDSTVRLINASFKGTKFVESDLSYCDLTLSDVEGAFFDKATDIDGLLLTSDQKKSVVFENPEAADRVRIMRKPVYYYRRLMARRQLAAAQRRAIKSLERSRRVLRLLVDLAVSVGAVGVVLGAGYAMLATPVSGEGFLRSFVAGSLVGSAAILGLAAPAGAIWLWYASPRHLDASLRHVD
jgi:uncharacterized protein YjbI with pentapeptide repeats